MTADKSTNEAGGSERSIEERFASQREVFQKLAVWDRLPEFQEIAHRLEQANKPAGEAQTQAHN